MKFKQSSLEAFWLDPVSCSPAGIPADLQRVLYRKLQMLDAAYTLNDLRAPPGNHLEKLFGNRNGQYCIRVNRQWRLCFIWVNHEALEVELCDYH